MSGPLDQPVEVDAQAEHSPLSVGHHDRDGLGRRIDRSKLEQRPPEDEQCPGSCGEFDSGSAEPDTDLERQGQALSSQVLVLHFSQTDGGEGCELRGVGPVRHGAKFDQTV